MWHREENTIKSATIINVRKIAALDIAFHGRRFILAEFALGMVLCAALASGACIAPPTRHS
jgi:hypothetical protein